MVILKSPGQFAPAYPSVALEVPDDWVALTYPGAILAARAKDGPVGAFAPNVVLTIVRHETGYTAADAAEVLESELADLPGASLRDAVKDPRSSGGEARAVAFIDPTAGTLVQLHVLVAVPSAVCVDVVHLVATLSAARLEQEEPIVFDVVNSLEVEMAAVAPPGLDDTPQHRSRGGEDR